MDESTLILALETSTDQAGVALARGPALLEEVLWRPGRNQTTELLPTIDALLKRHGLAPRELGALAVARGPGSFTGLRVALATAKGLALALAIPITAVGTLEMEAFAYGDAGRPVCPVLDAGRGDLYVALFGSEQGSWRQLWEEQLAAPSEVATRVPEGTIFCGEIPAWASDALAAAGRGTAIAAVKPRSAGVLASLGWQRLRRGEAADAATLQPLYIRRPSITTRRKP
ncbi:MAG: tRNA (adenosine(37)-N6)-threonylcarbamoyltransferase complex dimerization subunit type 1 TsaB [Dehalococcoidia bacterium]|nr:tRNA (adenosine(37)-N6)-threonylcarbamoyltransferase complex dimerization subunit type 1 TsaB [Dehalococcoidia bacterium]